MAFMCEKKIPGFVWAISFLVCLIFMSLAWHDVQTAHGVGLYLFLQIGGMNRNVFDLLTDVAGIAGMIALSVLPCLRRNQIAWRNVFCFAALGIAFLPFVDPGELVHFPEKLFSCAVRKEFLDGEFADAFFLDAKPLMSLFELAVPLFFIIVGLISLQRDVREKYRRTVLKVLPTVVILAFFGFVFETLSKEAFFAAVYLFLWLVFAGWEILSGSNEKLGKGGMILFVFFACRGIYRLLDIMSNTHI